MLTGRKLALTLAFTVLVALATGVSCKGFFPNPTMASFTLSSTTPTVPLDGTEQLNAFGVDSNGNQMGSVTDIITWMSSAPGTIGIGTAGTIPPTTPGLMSGVTLSTSTVTITASYEALSPQTATATVCLEGGSDFTITQDPSGTITGSTTPEVDYTASANVGGEAQDITSGVQWTSSNTAVMTIVSGTDPAVASVVDPTSQTKLTISASYTCNGTTNNFNISVTVNP
jgi:hypothetical protein